MKIIIVSSGKESDISDLVSTIQWSGDSKQVARQLDFSYVTGEGVPKVSFKLGDLVVMRDDKNVERFRGYVFARDKSSSGTTISVTCYDGLIYLVKSSGTYNFKNSTPRAITQKIARDFNIKVGTLPLGKPIKRIFDGVNLYEIIMTAYTLESNKTGKQYMPKMNSGRLSVIEKGKVMAKYTLDSRETILEASYSESMESSINVVKVYNDKDKYIGEVSIKGVPGRLQAVHKGTKTEARGLLQGIEELASIEALGDFECVTGNAVQVYESNTGLRGVFYIENDTHQFDNGIHTMTLELAFKNIMDKKDAGDNE